MSHTPIFSHVDADGDASMVRSPVRRRQRRRSPGERLPQQPVEPETPHASVQDDPLASSPFAASVPDVSAHKLSLSVVALSVLPAKLETVLQRFMPVQNFVCVVPEPDVYQKHKDKDIFVHRVSSPTEFLLYLKRTVEHKVRVRTLPNMASVMSWVQSALDPHTCARFLENEWPAVAAAAHQADMQHVASPEAYVIFLQSFTHFFDPRMDEDALYHKYEQLMEGGELSLVALHEWTHTVKTASDCVVGTEFWAPKKELATLLACKRVPVEILLHVASANPASFAECLAAIERVVRKRMKVLAKRGNLKSQGSSVSFVGAHQAEFQEPVVDIQNQAELTATIEDLKKQVASLQLGNGGTKPKPKPKGKGAGSGAASGGDAKVKCLVCNGPHFAKKCPYVLEAKRAAGVAGSGSN